MAHIAYWDSNYVLRLEPKGDYLTATQSAPTHEWIPQGGVVACVLDVPAWGWGG